MYDESGNLTQVIDEEGITSLSYNQFNQLVGIEQSNGSSMVLMYDGFGNLINTTQTVRNYDIEALNELLDDISPEDLPNFKTVNIEQYTGEYNNTYLHQVIKTLSLSDYTYEEVKTYKPEVMSYTYVNDITKQHPDILVKIDNVLLTSENTIYGYNQLQSGELNYQYDGLGNITTYTANNDTETVTYDPFGNTESDVTNEFGYNSEYNVTEDLQYLRARYYNPETARFITQDTVYGNVEEPLSQNRYTYTQNNPVYYDDPSGNGPINWLINSLSTSMILVNMANEYIKYLEGTITYDELCSACTKTVAEVIWAWVPFGKIVKFNDEAIVEGIFLIKGISEDTNTSNGGKTASKSNDKDHSKSTEDGVVTITEQTTDVYNSSDKNSQKKEIKYCTEIYYVQYIVYSYSGNNGMEYV